jgi:tRNA (cmo5U34)-methyltransferase
MSRDKLFRNGESAGDFQFNARVADVFDDMLARSVPSYAGVIAMSCELLTHFLRPGDRIYDLGCSTGNTLLELARHLEPFEPVYIGIDRSPAMIDKATRKAELFSKADRIRFLEADITGVALQEAGAVILNYTLQFVRPLHRLEFLQKLHTALRPGGVLIMSEKVISPQPLLNRTFIDIHLDFKRDQGYSEIEIAKKREALENVLIPFSIEENRSMLEKAGFATIETFYQWFNFVSWVAVKE